MSYMEGGYGGGEGYPPYGGGQGGIIRGVSFSFDPYGPPCLRRSLMR